MPPPATAHFHASLAETDPTMADILAREGERQRQRIELIASENLASRAVLEALGSTITNKTVEGYPGARFHGGAEVVDEAERLAVERARSLFGAGHANVQPHSGTQANQAVFLALLRPGDPVLSLSLTAGGHLSHGAAPSYSGKWFEAHAYGVEPDTGLIDYAQAERLAREHRPRLVITGGSAYPRTIDFERFRAIADAAGAQLLVDMAHFAGLVAGGAHPSPVPHADLVTFTTTKTLRGPRGGVVLTRDPDLARRIDAAVFPGVQGSVHLATVAAKAVCLGEALRPEFRDHARRVVANARAFAGALADGGVDVVTGGTDTHLVLARLPAGGPAAAAVESLLARAGITCNKNPVPGDAAAPSRWTGLRFGTASATTRGLGEAELTGLGTLVARLASAAGAGEAARERALGEAREHVRALCERFPVYPEPERATLA